MATRFITKNHKKIPIKVEGIESVQERVKENMINDIKEKRNDMEGFAKSKSLQSLSDKELVKAIGGEGNNPENEKFYVEIERRNQLVPHPKHERVGKVFRDDPNAIENMGKKVQNFQNEVDYWKKIIKFPRRDFSGGASKLGDNRWWALTNASTNLRDAKKKLDKLRSDKEKGITLTRETTFKGGKKRFFFKEHTGDENK